MAFEDIDDIEDALRSASASARDLHAVWEHRQPVPERDTQKTGARARAEGRQIAWLQSNLALARRFTNKALEKEEAPEKSEANQARPYARGAAHQHF